MYVCMYEDTYIHMYIYEVHFKSNAHAAKNQSNLFIHITSFNVATSSDK